FLQRERRNLWQCLLQLGDQGGIGVQDVRCLDDDREHRLHRRDVGGGVVHVPLRFVRVGGEGVQHAVRAGFGVGEQEARGGGHYRVVGGEEGAVPRGEVLPPDPLRHLGASG